MGYSSDFLSYSIPLAFAVLRVLSLGYSPLVTVVLVSPIDLIRATCACVFIHYSPAQPREQSTLVLVMSFTGLCSGTSDYVCSLSEDLVPGNADPLALWQIWIFVLDFASFTLMYRDTAFIISLDS